jgi:pilus assembly protein CpaE
MKIPVFFIGDDSIALASLRQQLEKELTFTVHKKSLGFADVQDQLRKTTSSALVIVDLGRDHDRTFLAVEDLKRQFPSSHLVMTAADSSSQTILRALRAGAEEFFAQPFNWPEVTQSIDRLHERIQVQISTNRSQGQLVSVFSTKGGAGTTTVATNLAIALATPQRSVCLVDLVLQFGALTSFLNLEASYTILDFVKNLQRIDPMFLEGSLVKHASGVRVLAEPFYAEEAARVTASDIDQILDTLIQSFDFVVTDTPKELDEISFEALEKAQVVLFVMEMNIPALKSAHKAIESFERLRINPKKLRLVINRYEKSKLLTQEAVERTLGLETFWILPNDYPTAVTSLNQGLPIRDTSPHSKLAKSYHNLAEAVIQDLSSATSDKRREDDHKKTGLLSRWLTRRSA